MRDWAKACMARLLHAMGVHATTRVSRDEVMKVVSALRPVAQRKSLRRIGPNADGGYLLPDDLAGVAACFSPGVSDESGFEQECAEMGMDVYLADGSVDGPSVEHPSFRFEKLYLASSAGENRITMADWVGSSGVPDDADLILQMDIEGSEYEVLISMSKELLERFRILVVEFHDLHSCWSRPFHRLVSAALDKLSVGHTCVHVHPNNRCGMEMLGGVVMPRALECTFLRNDRLVPENREVILPHPLDRSNVRGRDLALPAHWTGGGVR